MYRSALFPRRSSSALATLVVIMTAALVLGVLPADSAKAAVPGTSNGGVRIMPLGDSITFGQGFDNPSGPWGGYRTTLWNDLSTDHVVDFVGGETAGPSTIDPDHEGHPGWTIDQIAAQVTRWLYVADPHTVLLQIGANDLRSGNLPGGVFDLDEAQRDLSALIDRITLAKPNARVLVASTTPAGVGYDTYQQRIVAYNARVQAVAQSKGPNVQFVDIFAALTRADISDDLHPNLGGYVKMGHAWNAALRSSPLQPLQPVASVQPVDGVVISLKAYNGLYVSAWQGPAGTPLQARSPHALAWEQFQIVDAGNGFFGLKSVGNGKYVSTVNGVLLANSPHLAAWEMFRWVDLGNYQFGLASTNGYLVSARIGTPDNPLQAVAPHLAGWEIFTWSLA